MNLIVIMKSVWTDLAVRHFVVMDDATFLDAIATTAVAATRTILSGRRKKYSLQNMASTFELIIYSRIRTINLFTLHSTQKVYRTIEIKMYTDECYFFPMKIIKKEEF